MNIISFDPKLIVYKRLKISDCSCRCCLSCVLTLKDRIIINSIPLKSSKTNIKICRKRSPNKGRLVVLIYLNLETCWRYNWSWLYPYICITCNWVVWKSFLIFSSYVSFYLISIIKSYCTFQSWHQKITVKRRNIVNKWTRWQNFLHVSMIKDT